MPVAEAAPVIEEAPTPAVEEAPVAEAAPIVEGVPAPAIEEVPMAESAPIVEEASAVEETPAPMIEEVPVAEASPIVEETPAPAAEEVPAEMVEEVPVAETAPAVEETPASEEALLDELLSTEETSVEATEEESGLSLEEELAILDEPIEEVEPEVEEFTDDIQIEVPELDLDIPDVEIPVDDMLQSEEDLALDTEADITTDETASEQEELAIEPEEMNPEATEEISIEETDNSEPGTDSSPETEIMTENVAPDDIDQATEAMVGAVEDITSFLKSEDFEYTRIALDEKTEIVLIKMEDGDVLYLEYEDDIFLSLVSHYEKDGKHRYKDIMNSYIKDSISNGVFYKIMRSKGSRAVCRYN
nr:hypothetical protein [Butyrivibrio sp. AC2005]